MVDKISKSLSRLNAKEKKQIQDILEDIKSGKIIGNYDIKKLSGHDGIYRIRKGKIRIIYRLDLSGEIYVLAIERRSDITYNL